MPKINLNLHELNAEKTELDAFLARPDAYADPAFSTENKRLIDLQTIIEKATLRETLEAQLAEAKELAQGSDDLAELAKSEVEEATAQLEAGCSSAMSQEIVRGVTCSNCERRIAGFVLAGRPRCLWCFLRFRPMLCRSLLTALVVLPCQVSGVMVPPPPEPPEADTLLPPLPPLPDEPPPLAVPPLPPPDVPAPDAPAAPPFVVLPPDPEPPVEEAPPCSPVRRMGVSLLPQAASTAPRARGSGPHQGRNKERKAFEA